MLLRSLACFFNCKSADALCESASELAKSGASICINTCPALTKSPICTLILVARPSIGVPIREVKFSSKMIFPLRGSVLGAKISLIASIFKLTSWLEFAGNTTSLMCVAGTGLLSGLLVSCA